jgi:hypothetical protein
MAHMGKGVDPTDIMIDFFYFSFKEKKYEK